MNWTGAILSLLTAAAGWFYLFYSRAAERLADLEQQTINRRRIQLRRFGGAIMFLLGAAMYVGFEGIDLEQHPMVFVSIWVGIMAGLVLLVVLAAIDVRLTWKLTQRRRMAANAKNELTPPTNSTDHASS